MATPNYSYEKRQRELAKKRKADEKRQRKQPGGHDAPPEPPAPSPVYPQITPPPAPGTPNSGTSY